MTRDYVFDLDAGDGRAPLLSIFGGKITTYRKLAEHALAKLQPVMGFTRGEWTAGAALPGGDIPNADFAAFLATARARAPLAAGALLHRWARAYGTRLAMIVGGASRLAGSRPGSGRRPVRGRGRLSRRARVGAHGGGHALAPLAARACMWARTRWSG